MFTQEELERVGIEAMLDAYENHQKLGKNNILPYKKNQFGETCLEGDWQAEERVIETFGRHKVPITIISEEHGRIEIGKEFTCVLDGQDGTNRLIAFMNGDENARYGTMLGIFRGTDPTYEDYIFNAIMEHRTSRLIFGAKNKGAFSMDVSNNTTTHVQTSQKRDFNMLEILADYYPGNPFNNTLEDYVKKLHHVNSLRSSAAHYVDLVSGKVDVVIECTRKGNLEFAVGYGMVREAGGVVVTLDGEDIGNKKYFDFGQKEHIPVVFASDIYVARKFIKQIE
ncbi:MAG: hypothetical protein HYW24_05085 [Candidatus Aenigmarchaeota archaeon]|nr:hypothetical protein [Candidatus Aenigmarchaeota archaeon]